ncbi:MAG: adenylate/guanylate cyclase domain-containing protein [Rhodospirillales bacterium]
MSIAETPAAEPSAYARLKQFLFGPAPEQNLPERIRQSIAEQQRQSEILVGWIQLSLVLTMATLYSLSPKTTAPDAIMVVPFALGIYFAITVARLIASYVSSLPHWALTVSTVVDIALLMVLIWSFHIQYEQPASFYLKAPTMLYAFIFIALRALRFDARYVLLAGASAIGGWLVLMVYVLYAVPDDPMITRDYVEYLTSNSILIGAEVDKLISIGLVTLVLAVAIFRAERMLRRATLDAVAAQDLSRFVSREVADRITHADETIRPGDGESKVATVMFTDIEGFSTISEKLTSAELVRTLNDYFGAIYEAIRPYGGVIAQYQGDAMLITFNTVTANEDHAANAVRTALVIQDLMASRTFGDGIAMKTRCGINTGEMTVGAVGAEERLIFTVHGDEVNIAARLEQICKQYETHIMVTASTRDAAGDEFDYERMGEVVVRGRTRPTDIYTVRRRND